MALNKINDPGVLGVPDWHSTSFDDYTEWVDNISDESVQDQTQNMNPISAEIYVSPNPTWLSVEADGNLVYSGVLLPQSVQKFEAKEKINVTSGKGNETFVKVNGKDMGAISSDPGVVRDIQYNSNGKINSENKN